MSFNQELGERIKACRARLGLRQEDVGAALGLSAQAVAGWERGETAPDIAALPTLSRLLDISIARLLEGEPHLEGTVDATVLATSARGFTALGATKSAVEFAATTRTLHFHLTEAVLRRGGIPIKYAGDALLALFTGAEAEIRTLRAAHAATRVAGFDIRVGVASGPVYVGQSGHPEYATRDVFGPTVNLAFRLAHWAATGANTVAAANVDVAAVAAEFDLEPHLGVWLKGFDAARTVLVVRLSAPGRG
jgi:class 3 adenylate cyclase